VGADAFKYIVEIFKRINLKQLATGDQAVDDSGPFSTGITSGKQPILSFM
jgi:hypothetical protein